MADWPLTEATTSELQAWHSHKHSVSTDSEVSYFEPSSTSTHDSWSGYFDDWDQGHNDSFCPTIASCESSPSKLNDSTLDEPELLPTACPRPSRPLSQRRDADLYMDVSQSKSKSQRSSQRSSHQSNASRKSRRYGMVPYGSPTPGDEATANLNNLLQNAMSNTEDILSAMYSSNWDAASLQKWYQTTAQGPSDLALFKIMFSLRYTADDPSPLP